MAIEAVDDNAGKHFSFACAIVFLWERFDIMSKIPSDETSETESFCRGFLS